MEAMRQFNRYCKATNTSAYHLVIPPATSNDDEVVLDNMQRLSHYNFEHLVRVCVCGGACAVVRVRVRVRLSQELLGGRRGCTSRRRWRRNRRLPACRRS